MSLKMPSIHSSVACVSMISSFLKLNLNPMIQFMHFVTNIFGRNAYTINVSLSIACIGNATLLKKHTIPTDALFNPRSTTPDPFLCAFAFGCTVDSFVTAVWTMDRKPLQNVCEMMKEYLVSSLGHGHFFCIQFNV
eukprot:826528_1